MGNDLLALAEGVTRNFRRSLLSALYLSVVTIAMVAAPNLSTLLSLELSFIFPITVFLAVPFAHGAYEIIMPFSRLISARPVMTGFKKVVYGKCNIDSINYEFLQGWRKTFLDNPTSEYLKTELVKNLAMRQQWTYLFSNCFSSLLVITAIGLWSDDKKDAMLIGIAISATFAMVEAIAHLNRSRELGRTYGRAYLSWLESQRGQIKNERARVARVARVGRNAIAVPPFT